MMDRNRRSAVISLIVSVISGAAVGVGISFPDWHDGQGLWQICGDGNITKCDEITYKYDIYSDEAAFLWTSQGVLTTGFGIAVLSIFLLIYCTVRPSSSVIQFCAISLLLAGVMECVGVVLYSSGFLLRTQNSFSVPDGWAFWLTCTGSGVHLIMGIILLIYSRSSLQRADDQTRII